MPQTESSAAAIYRRLLRYARPHWWIVAAAAVPVAIYAAIGTAFPLLMTEIFEQLQLGAKLLFGGTEFGETGHGHS